MRQCKVKVKVSGDGNGGTRGPRAGQPGGSGHACSSLERKEKTQIFVPSSRPSFTRYLTVVRPVPSSRLSHTIPKLLAGTVPETCCQRMSNFLKATDIVINEPAMNKTINFNNCTQPIPLDKSCSGKKKIHKTCSGKKKTFDKSCYTGQK